MTDQKKRSRAAGTSAGSTGSGQDLRQRAEARAGEEAPGTTEDGAALSPEETRKTLHELRVYQIELEMQNEELRRVQAALEASCARYFDLFDLAPIGYLILTETGLIREANLAAAALLGTERRALAGRPLSRFILAEDQDIYYLHTRRLLAAGRPQTCELRLLGQGAEPFHVRLDAVLLREEGSAPICRCAVVDIDERKRAETQRAEQISLVQTVFDTTPRFLVLKDRNSVYREVNLPFCQFIGKPREAIIGKTDFELFSPQEAAAYRAGDAAVMETGNPESADWLVSGGEGKRWLHVTKNAVRDADGKINGVLCSVDDITERKQMEAALLQAKKSESLGRMAGAVAHHYNNLLSVVLGSLELAARPGVAPEEEAELMAEARSAANRAADMSRLMLAYLGKSAGTRKPLYLAAACRGALDAISSRLPAKVRLETALAPPGPVVRADAAQLRQALDALLINAAEALGETGGTITVTVTEAQASDFPAERVLPADWQPAGGRHVCLSVSDTGPGMTPDISEKIFDPFFSTKFTGRGLGLPVVLGIAKAHEGAVSVESRTGAGTVVRVFLPRSDEKPPVTSAGSVGEPAAPPAERGLVLVVDDEPAIRRMAEAMLRRLGFEALVAPNGADAVEIFRQRPGEIRCVLCDLTMPGMSGWETLSALRRIRADVPVVLCSGYDEAGVMADDRADLPQAFLGKPYDNKKLSDALAKALLRIPPIVNAAIAPS